ncbi:MAG: CDGSH iron-sulfur domain-containing protein [Gammaproteobacteria bacterium]
MSKDNVITPIENGPLHITGTLELLNADGDLIEKTEELYLCRCGQSNNKPYCDGQHKKAGFEESAVFVTPPESEEERNNQGLLSIKVQANGPLIFRGDVCIQDARGQKIFRKVGGLCRCEKSANRPFCDGTHSKIGFVAE